MSNPLVFTVFADLHYKEGMYSIGGGYRFLLQKATCHARLFLV